MATEPFADETPAAEATAAVAVPMTEEEERAARLEKQKSVEELMHIGLWIRVRCNNRYFEGLLAMIRLETIIVLVTRSLSPKQHSLYVLGDHFPSDEDEDALQEPEPVGFIPAQTFASARERRQLLRQGNPRFTAKPESPPVFVTLNRKKISEVKKISAPIRFPPTKERPHKEFLRIFVRRYFIRTDAGKNPESIPLATFISARTGWKQPNEEFLLEMEAEERENIASVVDDVCKKRQAMKDAQARRRADAGEGDQADNAALQEEMDEATLFAIALAAARLAPDGVEGDDLDHGRQLLEMSGLPTYTSCLAIIHLIVAVIALLYSAAVFSTIDDPVVSDFLTPYSTWIAVAAVLQIVQAGVSGAHAMQMRYPTTHIPSIARMVALVINFIAQVLCVATIGSAVFSYKELYTGDSLQDSYREAVRSEAEHVCAYARTHRCSGYSTACVIENVAAECINGCGATALYRDSCREHYESSAAETLIPSFAIALLAIVIFLVDGVLWIKFVRYIQYLDSR